MDLLDIVLHYGCNLKCTYCTCTGKMDQVQQVTLREAAQQIDIAARAGCDAISITGGEPTLRSDLMTLIKYAEKRGLTDIKLQTNGLMFASKANLERALDAGVVRIGVSVHGYNGHGDGLYQRVTQSDDRTLSLLLAAIDNMVEADVILTADLILMNQTVDTFWDGLVALHQRGVQNFNIWYVSLTDSNRDNVEELPRISEVIDVVKKCMDYGREHSVTVKSLHIPRCLLSGYEEHIAHPGLGQTVLVVTPESTFQLSASRLSGGVKPSRCKQCIYDSVCPGLREDYVEHYDDTEVQPVTGDGMSSGSNIVNSQGGSGLSSNS